MISQLIDVLELAITINYVMIGTQFESSTEGMEDPSNLSGKNVIQNGKPGKLGKLSESLGRSAKIRSSMSKKLIAAVPDIADVSSSFSMEKMKATTALPRPV